MSVLLDSSVELFNMDLIKLDDFLELIIRFIFNFVVTFIIVRRIYYPRTHRRDFFFTFVLISSVVFLMCFLLENVKLQLGFALGLFAVFGIIRYRTTTIPIKEMTYLFIVIGVSVINALVNKKISWAELVFANLVILAISYFVERLKTLEPESFATVMYEKIELVIPERKQELIEDLEKKLGVKISRIEVTNVDYIRDTAKINVFFLKSNQVWSKEDDIDFRTSTDE